MTSKDQLIDYLNYRVQTMSDKINDQQVQIKLYKTKIKNYEKIKN